MVCAASCSSSRLMPKPGLSRVSSRCWDPRHAHSGCNCPDRARSRSPPGFRTGEIRSRACAVRTSSWSWPTTSPGISSSTCRTFARCSPRARRSRASSSRLAVLPLTRDDLHGEVPAQHGSLHQRRAGRWVLRVPQLRAGGPRPSRPASARRLHDRPHGQVPQRLHPHPLGRRTEPVLPPGWDEWDVGGKGYANYDYGLNENGRYRYYGTNTEDYLTDVIAAKGAAWVNR